jgi:hypothetical protein
LHESEVIAIFNVPHDLVKTRNTGTFLHLFSDSSPVSLLSLWYLIRKDNNRLRIISPVQAGVFPGPGFPQKHSGLPVARFRNKLKSQQKHSGQSKKIW